MLTDLQRDWRRWSRAERVAAALIGAASTTFFSVLPLVAAHLG